MTHKDALRKLEDAVIEAARQVCASQEVSGSTLPPGERGIGGQMMTGWIRAERFEDLIDATYELMRYEQRQAEGLDDA